MKIQNPRILRAIFALKGDLRPGLAPPPRESGPVSIAPFKGNTKAAVSLSADFELAWAFRNSASDDRDRKAQRTRENIPFLLALFEKHEIPITWAAVGHLFLDRCERGPDGRPHPDMPRPPRNARWDGDWYRHDPCTDVQTDPFWYCPDLIRLIQASPARHEIGTHSFSHVDFSPETSTPDLVAAEMDRCRKVMHPFGIEPRSLVYPYNLMGDSHLALLAEKGITCVRQRSPKVRLSYPDRDPSGVHRIVESMNLRLPRFYDYAQKARIYLEEAVRRRAAYHLWFHPSDPLPVFDGGLRPIVEHLAALRRDGLVWIATMGELAAYCEARHATRLQTLENAGGVEVRVTTSYDARRYGESRISLVLPAQRAPTRLIVSAGAGDRPLAPAHWRFDAGRQTLHADIPAVNGRFTALFD
jgi:peptidoglycan/xylan/chitin deacetylase (PgdA/CDA1 family)